MVEINILNRHICVVNLPYRQAICMNILFAMLKPDREFVILVERMWSYVDPVFTQEPMGKTHRSRNDFRIEISSNSGW